MVVAPEKPSTEQPKVSRRWMWFAIALIAAVGALGIVLGITLAGDSASEGPGPQGPVGPEGDMGPEGESVPDAELLEGSGVIVTETRAVEPFRRLELSGVAAVVVTTEASDVLEIETDHNLVPLMETSAGAGVLRIATNAEGFRLQPTEDIVVRVGTAELERIEHRGVGSVSVGALVTDQLTIEFTGVGTIDVAGLEAETLVVEGSGTGSVSLSGAVAAQTVSLGGLADYRAGDLESETASITHAGTGSAELWVEGQLDVAIQDLGSVSYFGDPELTSEIVGTGDLIALGVK